MPALYIKKKYVKAEHHLNGGPFMKKSGIG